MEVKSDAKNAFPIVQLSLGLRVSGKRLPEPLRILISVTVTTKQHS